MGLNCKPGQHAWISIPRTHMNEVMGLAQLNGRVVKTIGLAPDSTETFPVWNYEPPTTIRVMGNFISQLGFVWEGTILKVTAMPDAYLRPFEDFPPEEIEQLERELAA